MKKSIKPLSIIMIAILVLFSALPTFAEDTYISENSSSTVNESAIADSESVTSDSTTYEDTFTANEGTIGKDELTGSEEGSENALTGGGSTANENTGTVSGGAINDINDTVNDNTSSEDSFAGSLNELTDSEITQGEGAGDDPTGNTSEGVINENVEGANEDVESEESFAGGDSDLTGSESPANEDTGSVSKGAINCNTDILDVSLPISVSITLDPYELKGRGQIYSDTYKFQNLGTTGVSVTFTEMKVIFPNDTDFEALAQSFDMESKSDLKSIYLVMNFGRADILPVVLTDNLREGPVSITMAAIKADAVVDNSFFSLNFSGNLNENPAYAWCDGDVKINIQYYMEVLTAEDPGTTPAGAEYELDQTEPPPPETDTADEEAGDAPTTETTPAGASFELDQPDSALQETDPSGDVSGDVDSSVSSPAGITIELDQSDSSSHNNSSSDESSDDSSVGAAIPETTPAGASFESGQAGSSSQDTDSSDASSGDKTALESTPPPGTVLELNQAEYASPGFGTADELSWEAAVSESSPSGVSFKMDQVEYSPQRTDLYSVMLVDSLFLSYPDKMFH